MNLVMKEIHRLVELHAQMKVEAERRENYMLPTLG